MTNKPEPNTRAGEALAADNFKRTGEWPDTTSEMLETVLFDTIWRTIKTWDVNVPHAYSGYMGATGNHVRAIYDAVAPMLTRPLPQPSNTCEMPEVAAVRYIEQLRSNYGTVTILPDNEEAETRDMQMAVDCCGEWTNWSDQRFYGETVIQCLARAVVILEKWKDMNNVE